MNMGDMQSMLEKMPLPGNVDASQLAQGIDTRDAQVARLPLSTR